MNRWDLLLLAPQGESWTMDQLIRETLGLEGAVHIIGPEPVR